MAATKAAGNVTVTYNSNDISAYVNSAQIEADIAELDTTNMSSTAMESIPGLANWSFTASIPVWDSTLDGYLAPDAVTPTQRTLAVAYTDSGSNTVTYTWTSNCAISSASIGGSADGLITSDYSFQCSGAPGRVVS